MPRINVNQQLVSIDGVQRPSHTAAWLSAFTAAAQHAQGQARIYKCDNERRRRHGRMTNLTIFSKGSLGVDFVTKKQRGGKLAAASHVAAMTRGKVAGKEYSFRNDVAERIRKKGCVLARASAGKLATWAGCPHAPRSQVCQQAVDLVLRGIAHEAQALQRQRNRQRGKLSK